MLFLTTITKVEGVGRDKYVINKATGTQYVLDINNVTNLKQEGTGSKFLYQSNPANKRGGHEEIHCTTPYLTVKSEFDISPTSSVLELSVFPNNDVTKTPFSTYINVYDFSYAWAHNPYPQYTWLVYCAKGSKEKRILVDMTLSELLQLDYQFDENNVQWYYFVDPIELIHPEWYIRVEPITDIDGNIYTTVTIGTQVWMVENLRTTKYRDGTPITNPITNVDWLANVDGGYSWYNNNISNKGTYGAVYNWYAVSNIHNLAPTGWRVATENDYLVLIAFLGGEAITGGKLKEAGLSHWIAPNIGATNSSGFTAVPSGYRGDALIAGNFSSLLASCYLWSNTEHNIATAHSFGMGTGYEMIIKPNNNKNYGFAVRCIKE